MATCTVHPQPTPQDSFQTEAKILSSVPMSIFNRQILDEATRLSRAQEKIAQHSSLDNRTTQNSRRSREYNGAAQTKDDQKPQIRASMSITLNNEIPPQPVHARIEKFRCGLTEQSTSLHYSRPVGPELVSSRHPSCIGLPSSWDNIHDRFIAYLATHAPLDGNGKIPVHEERKERWETVDIVRLVKETFPTLGGDVKGVMIEKRLALLDLAGDNDYFKIPYGAYKCEDWGRGI